MHRAGNVRWAWVIKFIRPINDSPDFWRAAALLDPCQAHRTPTTLTHREFELFTGTRVERGEFDAYLAALGKTPKTDPWKFWEAAKLMPTMRHAAQFVLAMPAVVTACDAVLSVAGSLLCSNQAAMTPSHFGQLLAIRCNEGVW